MHPKLQAERNSLIVSCKPYTNLATYRRTWRKLVLWLCVVMLALQPLETLAAVQPRVSAPSTAQGSRNLSAEGADFAAKDVALAEADLAPLAPRP
jgi:hypothetical protein